MGTLRSMGARLGGARNLANILVPKSDASASLTISQTKMITASGKSSDVAKALEVFEQMPQRNQVSYNAMLSVLIDSGRLDSASQLFSKMPRKNARSYTSMIAGLARSGRVTEARRLFDSIPSRRGNVFTWTAMISCYVQNDVPLEAVSLFAGFYADFFELKVIPNSHTFSAVIKSCSCLQSPVALRQMHSLSLKLLEQVGRSSVFVQNALIDAYAKLDCLLDAEDIFRRMKWKDLTSWNTMMDGYAHNFLLDKAFEIFNCMKEKDALSWNIMMSSLIENRQGFEALKLFISLSRLCPAIKPNASTYTIVLTACVNHAMLEFGRQIHAHVVKNSLFPHNIFVSNSLVTMYANCGLIEELEQVFNEMPNNDVVSWNSVIQGFGQNGQTKKALEFAETALSLRTINGNTFTTILTSCSHGGLVTEGLEYFKSMSRKFGIEPNLDHYICAVDMLGRAGMVREAHDLLRTAPFAANSVAWSTLLNACSIHGSLDIGRVAAQELQALEAESTTGNGNESNELVNSPRQKHVVKEHGCSWLVEV